jgi:YfiH family protein
MQWIKPDWPVPNHIKAISTTRFGGVSQAPYDGLNLGTHVEDDFHDVLANRKVVRETLDLPSEPLWLEQVHSTVVANADSSNPQLTADASVSRQSGTVCVVMTADCLPVLMTNKQGTVIAAAHAGWRGLNGGVLETTISTMNVAVDDIYVWLGPAIGSKYFEVGDEVRKVFMDCHEESDRAFVGNEAGKWLADIYHLARIRLNALGVDDSQIYGGGLCTFEDEERFFSYRRQAKTGRMASLIWMIR